MNLEKEKNKDSIKLAWSELQARIRKIKLGGGKTRLEKKLKPVFQFQDFSKPIPEIHIKTPTPI